MDAFYSFVKQTNLFSYKLLHFKIYPSVPKNWDPSLSDAAGQASRTQRIRFRSSFHRLICEICVRACVLLSHKVSLPRPSESHIAQRLLVCVFLLPTILRGHSCRCNGSRKHPSRTAIVGHWVMMSSHQMVDPVSSSHAPRSTKAGTEPKLARHTVLNGDWIKATAGIIFFVRHWIWSHVCVVVVMHDPPPSQLDPNPHALTPDPPTPRPPPLTPTLAPGLYADEAYVLSCRCVQNDLWYPVAVCDCDCARANNWTSRHQAAVHSSNRLRGTLAAAIRIVQVKLRGTGAAINGLTVFHWFS